MSPRAGMSFKYQDVTCTAQRLVCSHTLVLNKSKHNIPNHVFSLICNLQADLAHKAVENSIKGMRIRASNLGMRHKMVLTVTQLERAAESNVERGEASDLPSIPALSNKKKKRST